MSDSYLKAFRQNLMPNFTATWNPGHPHLPILLSSGPLLEYPDNPRSRLRVPPSPRRSAGAGSRYSFMQDSLLSMRMPYQRPGRRVVTSWTSHALPSGSAKAKNDP
jgi:hypothetical protein